MTGRAVIWDLDGVLADTGEAHYRAWVTALAEWEIPLDRPTFARLFGMDNRATLEVLLGRPPEPKELGTIAARKEHLFRLEAGRIVQMLPGSLALLAGLETAGWLQALASSAPWANINLLVDKFDIRPRFQAILSGEDLPASKPDPALFLRAAEALRLPPGRCLVLEDSPAGVEAARRAGMRCLGVGTTRPPEMLAEADRVVRDLTQLRPETLTDLLDG